MPGRPEASPPPRGKGKAWRSQSLGCCTLPRGFNVHIIPSGLSYPDLFLTHHSNPNKRLAPGYRAYPLVRSSIVFGGVAESDGLRIVLPPPWSFLPPEFLAAIELHGGAGGQRCRRRLHQVAEELRGETIPQVLFQPVDPLLYIPPPSLTEFFVFDRVVHVLATRILRTLGHVFDARFVSACVSCGKGEIGLLVIGGWMLIRRGRDT